MSGSRRRFPLAAVLRVRRVQEDTARAQVIAAQQDRGAAEDDLLRREGVLDARRATVERHPNAAAFTAVLAARVALAAEAGVARQRRAEADAQVGQAVSAWAEARARVRAVEQLEQRHTEALAEADARAEAAEADDLSGAKAARRARETPR